jgi:hypothetical protein
MSMDMSDVLFDEDLLDSFQLVSFTSGQRDADSGAYTATYAAPASLTESIQPSSASDMMQFLPEGDRSKRSVSIYSKTQINMGDGATTQSDLIIWNGTTYRVAFSQLWKAYGYWFVMATETSPFNVQNEETAQ